MNWQTIGLDVASQALEQAKSYVCQRLTTKIRIPLTAGGLGQQYVRNINQRHHRVVAEQRIKESGFQMCNQSTLIVVALLPYTGWSRPQRHTTTQGHAWEIKMHIRQKQHTKTRRKRTKITPSSQHHFVFHLYKTIFVCICTCTNYVLLLAIFYFPCMHMSTTSTHGASAPAKLGDQIITTT